MATLQPEDSKATYLDDDINVLLHFKDFTLPTEEERTLFEIEFGIEYPLKTDKASLKVDNAPLKADKSPLKSGG